MVWLRKHGNLDWTLPKLNSLFTEKEKTPEQKIKELEAAWHEDYLKTVTPETSKALQAVWQQEAEVKNSTHSTKTIE